MTTVGTSIEGRPIEAFIARVALPGYGARSGPPSRGTLPTVLVFGGFHGDEPKSVFLARRLIDLLETDPTARGKTRWVVVPVVNPDGYERRKRRNARGVDLNRNFPTENWTPSSTRSRMFGGREPGSEPETQVVMAIVRRYRPSRIVAVHSINGGRECNNYDGPGRAIARKMQRYNGYPVTMSMAYPTPGSLGTWAGVERGIPTITLELPSRHSPKRCWEDNRPALLRPTALKSGTGPIF